jgi:hypothetical protein
MAVDKSTQSRYARYRDSILRRAGHERRVLMATPLGRQSKCTVCGCSFHLYASNPGQRTCSKACRYKSSAQKTVYARRAAQRCAICARIYQPKRAGTACCSRACGWKFMSAQATVRRSERKAENAARKVADATVERLFLCQYCSVQFVRKPRASKRFCSSRCARNNMARNNRVKAEARDSGTRTCLECHREFRVPYSHGARGPRRLCSRTCAKRRNRRSIRSNQGKSKDKSHATRARERGLPVERVNRVAVFARDCWRCQLCGKATPHRLLKSFKHPDAPTLDHIVPIASGGGHTWANVQCACRSCNSCKSAKPLGQFRLF